MRRKSGKYSGEPRADRLEKWKILAVRWAVRCAVRAILPRDARCGARHVRCVSRAVRVMLPRGVRCGAHHMRCAPRMVCINFILDNATLTLRLRHDMHMRVLFAYRCDEVPRRVARAGAPHAAHTACGRDRTLRSPHSPHTANIARAAPGTYRTHTRNTHRQRLTKHRT